MAGGGWSGERFSEKELMLIDLGGTSGTPSSYPTPLSDEPRPLGSLSRPSDEVGNRSESSRPLPKVGIVALYLHSHFLLTVVLLNQKLAFHQQPDLKIRFEN